MSEEIEIQAGKTYHNGRNRRRIVVGFAGYMVLFKTPSSGRTTTGIPIWDFKKWAKGMVE